MRRPLRLSLFTVLLAALLALGVLRIRTAQTQGGGLPVHIPDTVIFATNSVRLQANVQVVAGDIVVNNASVGPTLDGAGVELGMEGGGVTPAGSSLVADSISIGPNAIVNGNVLFNTLTNQGTITGTQSSPLPLPVFSPPLFPLVSPGVQNITVAANAWQTLAPGRYGDLTVQSGATLTLSPGTYQVRSLSIGAGARLWVQNLVFGSAKAEVRVLNQVTTAANVFIGPVDGNPTKAAQIIVYVGFANLGGGLTPAAATFGPTNTLLANIDAPNGTLVLGSNSQATGAFFAKDVDVNHDVHLDLEPFLTQQAPTITSANTTTFTVGQAGTFTVTTTGVPPVKTITENGALPSGVMFTDNGDGTATLSGTPAAGTAGVYPLTIIAGNGVTPSATQNFTLLVKSAQTISFTSAAPAGAQVGGPTYIVTATATSGLPVTFTIDASASTVCTIAGATVSFIGVGTCVIDANQAGNATYSPAPQVQQSFAVAKGDQTITFTSTTPAGAKVGGPTYTVTATATSGLAVTFTIDAAASTVCTIAGATVSFTGLSTCVIDANQAGNATYNAAPQVQQSFAVGKGDQTITFTSTAPAGAKAGGPTYTVTATATSGLPVAFTIDAAASTVCTIAGATVSFIGVGTCVIDANQAGNATYNAAPQVQQSFADGKGDQTITFTSAAPAGAKVGGPTYTVTATATSGLAVTITIDAAASAVCTIAGATVSFGRKGDGVVEGGRGA